MTMETITHSIDASGKARGADHDPDPEIPAKARRRQFSARYKAEVLAAYDQLPRSERGSFLRREGLYSSSITEWRHQRDRGALEALANPRAGLRPTPGTEKSWPCAKRTSAWPGNWTRPTR
jgi:transposase